MEKIFISSRMRGQGPYTETWQKVREIARDALAAPEHRVFMLEESAPDPRHPYMVFTQLVDNSTIYIGMWSTQYSQGTIDEFLRSSNKECYIFFLGCTECEVFQDEVPDNTEAIGRLDALHDALNKITYSPYPIASLDELKTRLSSLGHKFAIRSKWAEVSTYDPLRFVGRIRELRLCSEIALNPTNHPQLLVISGPSASGKTTFLRALGHRLSEQSELNIQRPLIVYLDGAYSPGVLVYLFLHQLGDITGGTRLLPKESRVDNISVGLARRWESFLACAVSPRLGNRLFDEVMLLMQKQQTSPIILLDDVQAITSTILANLILNIITIDMKVGFTLITSWRLDVENRMGTELQNLANTLAPKWGGNIKLGGFDTAQLAVSFLEQQLGWTLKLNKGNDAERLLRDFLPGDLDELAQFIKLGRYDIIDSSLLHTFLQGPSAVNCRRWDRLRRLQYDLRILSLAKTGAPTSLIADIAKEFGTPFRLKKLIAKGSALEMHRIAGEDKWCKVFPERFAEFIWKQKISIKMRRSMNLALLRKLLQKCKDEQTLPELYHVGLRATIDLEPRSKLHWLERFGRLALEHGWLRTSLEVVKPLLDSLPSSTFSGRRVDFLLELVDLLRQLADRKGATELNNQIEKNCQIDSDQKARVMSLRLRLIRDLRGGESSHRTMQRMLRRNPHIKMTSKLLDQLARIKRDTGRISEGLILSHQAKSALRKEKRSIRFYRTQGEVYYTLGSIARLSGDLNLAKRELERSVIVRDQNRDLQGQAYPLLELAMCALIEDKVSYCLTLLQRAENVSKHPEVKDQRSLAYVNIIRSIAAFMSGDETEARYRLQQSLQWKETREQGIRGNPSLLYGVLESRFGNRDEAMVRLMELLHSEDRTVRATANLLLSRLTGPTAGHSFSKRYERISKNIASRFGFSLYGIGAELLARLATSE